MSDKLFLIKNSTISHSFEVKAADKESAALKALDTMGYSIQSIAKQNHSDKNQMIFFFAKSIDTNAKKTYSLN